MNRRQVQLSAFEPLYVSVKEIDLGLFVLIAPSGTSVTAPQCICCVDSLSSQAQTRVYFLASALQRFEFHFHFASFSFSGLLTVVPPLVCPPQLVAAVSHGGYNFYCQKTQGPQDVDNRVGWLHATCTLYSIHTAGGFGFNLNRCFETFHPEMRSQPSVTPFSFFFNLLTHFCGQAPANPCRSALETERHFEPGSRRHDDSSNVPTEFGGSRSGATPRNGSTM